jgi:hypothetical protein
MITNPYDQPPAAPGNDAAQAWGQGFLFGLTGPQKSVEQAPDSISQEVLQAFEDGVLAGQQSAINGLDVFSGCIDTEEGEHVPLSAELGLEGVNLVGELLRGAKLATAAFSTIFMTVLDVALATHHFTPPEQVIDGMTREFFNTIESLGRDDCAFYIGGGVDFDQAGCQLLLTPLFRAQDQAHDAAVALGRPLWFVGEWHANQCGSLNVVDGSTQ